MDVGRNSRTSDTADREIVNERVVNAPRDLVWKVWTDPEHVVQWWGPRGFRNTNKEMSVKPGGVWRYTMHMANGPDFPNRVRFLEVVKPERLVYEHGDDEKVMFHVTVTFTEEGKKKTRIRQQSVFPTAEERNLVAEKYGAIEGARQHLERLEERLTLLQAEEAGEMFVITRELPAPRSLVWKAFTEGDRLAAWWAPKEFPTEARKSDVRPGGLFHYRMHRPEGGDLWGRLAFRDLVPEERLLFVTSFSDEHGGVTRAPFFDGTWPLEVLTEVRLEERAGKTAITLRGTPIDATDTERRTYVEGFESMRMGFGSALDQLAKQVVS